MARRKGNVVMDSGRSLGLDDAVDIRGQAQDIRGQAQQQGIAHSCTFVDRRRPPKPYQLLTPSGAFRRLPGQAQRLPGQAQQQETHWWEAHWDRHGSP